MGEVKGVELILPFLSNLSILLQSSWLEASNLFSISRMAWPVVADIEGCVVEAAVLTGGC